MAVITTYDDGNRLEDVMGAVFQLSPTDTPFTSGMAKTKAHNTIHQWPEDTLAARGDNAIAEGAAISYGTVTAPGRVVNLTQIYAKTFQVSSTEKWVKGAGVDDQYQYQKTKALLELANDIEHGFIRGSLASGNGSGTARRMAGALNFITTNATSVASETKLTESFFNGLGELIYAQGSKPDEVYVGARLKRIISTFTASGERQTSVDDKRLVNAVDVYESDFGIVKILLSRDQLNSATFQGNSLLMIKSSQFKMAVGEPIHVLPDTEVAQDKHGKNGVVRGELTLEVLGERHGAKALNLSGNFN